jgi:hypothetical protein
MIVCTHLECPFAIIAQPVGVLDLKALSFFPELQGLLHEFLLSDLVHNDGGGVWGVVHLPANG